MNWHVIHTQAHKTLGQCHGAQKKSNYLTFSQTYLYALHSCLLSKFVVLPFQTSPLAYSNSITQNPWLCTPNICTRANVVYIHQGGWNCYAFWKTSMDTYVIHLLKTTHQSCLWFPFLQRMFILLITGIKGASWFIFPSTKGTNGMHK